MLRRISNALLGTLTLFSLFFGLSTYAETSPTYLQNPAEIYVTGLTVDNTSLKVGETVNGSFTLQNSGNQAENDVMYSILLTGSIENGHPTAVFDQKTLGPVSFSANESVPVTFSYTIPAGYNGNLGIRIQAVLTDGFEMGWADQPISVSGTANALLRAATSTVVVNDSIYGADEGPTVYSGDIISFKGAYSSSAGISLTPSIALYKNAISATPLRTLGGTAVSFSANKNTDVTVALPLDLDPGTYIGVVRLNDIHNVNYSELVSFRYVVGGDIVSINSLSIDQKLLKSGDTPNVTIIYTGSPADITGSHMPHAVGAATAHIKLYDEKGGIISDTSADTTIESAGGQLSFQVPVNADARGISADVTIEKGGKVLAEKKSVLSVAPPVVPETSTLNLPYIILGVTGAIVLLLVIWLFRRGGRPSAGGTLAVMFAALILFSAGKAHAFTVIDSYNISSTIFSGTDWRPRVFVNMPAHTLQAGQTFNLEGTVQALACYNKPSDIGFTVTYQNVTYPTATTTRGRQNAGHHSSYSYLNNFSFGTYTAPINPGTYKIYLKVYIDPHIANGQSDVNSINYGWVYGYQEFTVSAATSSSPTVPPTTKPVSSNPSSGTTTSAVLGLSVSCVPSVIKPDGTTLQPATVAAVNQPVTWHGTVSGGVPPYTYSWHGDDVQKTSTNPMDSLMNTIVETYSRIGKKTMTLDVYDSGSPQQMYGTASCSVGGGVNVMLQPDWGQF